MGQKSSRKNQTIYSQFPSENGTKIKQVKQYHMFKKSYPSLDRNSLHSRTNSTAKERFAQKCSMSKKFVVLYIQNNL